MNKLTVLLALVVVACLGGAAYIGIGNLNRGTPSVLPESTAERESSVRAAFSPSADGSVGTSVTDDPHLFDEIGAFFEGLGEALASGDADEIEQRFSMEALFAYSEKAGLIDLAGIDRQELRNFIAGAKRGFANSAPTSAFSDPRIMRIERIRDGELIVYLRARNTALNIGIKQRWWLIKDADGKWRAYDNEDVEHPLRTSALLASVLSIGNHQRPWTADFIQLGKAMKGLSAETDGDTFSQIDNCTARLLEHRLPRAIEGFVCTLRAGALAENGDTGEVAELLDRVDELTPGAPGTYFLRGRLHFFEDEPEEAIDQFHKYVDVLGWDAEVHESLADCYLEIGDKEKCIEHARKGLADTPTSVGCLSSLAVSLPPDERGELDQHFDNMEGEESAYGAALDYAVNLELYEVRDYLLAKLMEDFPDSVLLGQYRVEADE